MKKIAKIIAHYRDKLNDIDKLKIEESHKYKKKIDCSKKSLNELRFYLRQFKFPTDEHEINFFKHQKPLIYGNLKYFTHVHKYLVEKPKSNILKHKKLVQSHLDKLETIKKKHINFFRYYEEKLEGMDSIYFLRGNSQYEFNFDTLHLDREPEFSTNKDFLAARIISYNLLSKYYSNELLKIEQQESNRNIKVVKPEILNDLSWTGTKTELVELLYGLNAVGAIRNGQAEMKKLVEVCKVIFGIDLGNVYKTYSEIKSREKEPTKFLDLMKINLTQKINSEQQ